MSDTLKSTRKFDVITIFEFAVGLFFFLFLCTLLLGFIPFTHPWVNNYTNTILKRAGVQDCSVGKVYVTIWKGIDIRDLKMAGKDDSLSYAVEFSKVKISCNLISCFVKWRKVKDDYDILSVDSLSRAYTNPIFINTVLRFASDFYELNSIDMYCKKCTITNAVNDTSDLSDFMIKMNRKKDNARMIETRFIVSQLNFKGTACTVLRGDADLEHGVIRLKRCRGRVFGGKFKLNGELDILTNHLRDLSLNATDFDIKPLVSKFIPDSIQLSGKTDINIDFDPGYFSIDSLKGDGVFHLSRFEIQNTPVQNALYQMLEIKSQIPLSFTKIKINVDLDADKTCMTNATGNGEMIDFKADGWIQPSGEFNQQVEATLSRDFSTQISSFVAASLEETSDGGRHIRCRIYGTAANPKLELDREIMKNAVNNVFRQMKESIQEFFKKN